MTNSTSESHESRRHLNDVLEKMGRFCGTRNNRLTTALIHNCNLLSDRHVPSPVHKNDASTLIAVQNIMCLTKLSGSTLDTSVPINVISNNELPIYALSRQIRSWLRQLDVGSSLTVSKYFPVFALFTPKTNFHGRYAYFSQWPQLIGLSYVFYVIYVARQMMNCAPWAAEPSGGVNTG